MKKVRIRFSSGFEVYFLNEEVHVRKTSLDSGTRYVSRQVRCLRTQLLNFSSSDSVERKEHFTDELSHVVNDNLHLDFPETTEENGASCTTVEQKYSSVEIPQSRKLTEKGLQYQIDMKVNSLKSKKTALTGTKTLRKTLLLRGKCS